MKCRFVLAVPVGRKWVRDIVDMYHDSIKLPGCHRKSEDGEALFMATHLCNRKGKRCYLHIYFNAVRAAADYDGFTGRLLDMKEESETDNADERHRDEYEEFFIVKETPARGRKVTFDVGAVERHRKRHAGFFCILTTGKMKPEEALKTYRNKDIVENCFDDLENGLDMKRLRIHSPETMASRLFVQFLALVLVSGIRNVIKSDPKLKNMTVREVTEAMEPIVKIRYSGRYGELITEVGPLQRDIMRAFGLELPT
jgi:transposase